MHSDACARYVLFNQRVNPLVICERSDRIRLAEPRVIRLRDYFGRADVDRLEDNRREIAVKFSRGKSLESTAPSLERT